jgi:hypothetical protein
MTGDSAMTVGLRRDRGRPGREGSSAATVDSAVGTHNIVVDENIPLHLRVAGDTGHALQLGRHRTALPPVLADLARTAVTTSAVGRSVPGPRWLFPGRLPGQHFTPAGLAAVLNRHGIQVRRGRNSALAALAADIPAAALSPPLRIGIETAARCTHWAKRTGRSTSGPCDITRRAGPRQHRP